MPPTLTHDPNLLWLFVVFLLYGLTFFTLGVAILSRDIRLSELAIARILWLLALFGIVHGFHEWLELLTKLFPAVLDTGFVLFRLVVMSVSFLFLLYFGIFLNIISLRGEQALATTPKWLKALVGASALLVILSALYLDFQSGSDSVTRLLVAFPGGLLSGIGLILYSRRVRTFSSKVANHFILAGSCMICYAIFSGLTSSAMVIPVIGVKIIALRGVSAFFIMFFTIRALSVFSVEQKELINEQLQRFAQSEKLTSMGILAAGIAHEINNPLANISLNVELLKDMVSSDERASRKVMAIERNIERASRIARELLHFSREKETSLEPVDLNQIIASALRLLKNQHNSDIIHLNLQDIPSVVGISWKLEEVFINLLLNSLDACTPDDRIDIATTSVNGGVKVTLSDSGQGIAHHHLAKVFDPFFTTKEVGKGTGLGLSVCYNIVQQHGGEITIDSKVKKGTRVTLFFPGVTPDE